MHNQKKAYREAWILADIRENELRQELRELFGDKRYAIYEEYLARQARQWRQKLNGRRLLIARVA